MSGNQVRLMEQGYALSPGTPKTKIDMLRKVSRGKAKAYGLQPDPNAPYEIKTGDQLSALWAHRGKILAQKASKAGFTRTLNEIENPKLAFMHRHEYLLANKKKLMRPQEAKLWLKVFRKEQVPQKDRAFARGFAAGLLRAYKPNIYHKIAPQALEAGSTRYKISQAQVAKCVKTQGIIDVFTGRCKGGDAKKGASAAQLKAWSQLGHSAHATAVQEAAREHKQDRIPIVKDPKAIRITKKVNGEGRVIESSKPHLSKAAKHELGVMWRKALKSNDAFAHSQSAQAKAEAKVRGLKRMAALGIDASKVKTRLKKYVRPENIVPNRPAGYRTPQYSTVEDLPDDIAMV
jgi:hypothetical protein